MAMVCHEGITFTRQKEDLFKECQIPFSCNHHNLLARDDEFLIVKFQW